MAVIVSGGTRGIGLEIAAALALPGATVVVGYRQDADVAEQACRRLAATGTRPLAIAADVGTAEGAAQLVGAAPADEPVEQLVHCAVEVLPARRPPLIPAASTTPWRSTGWACCTSYGRRSRGSCGAASCCS